MTRVVVTGANGFVGKNLTLRLGEIGGFEVTPVTRAMDHATLAAKIAEADAIVHLAGANRPADVTAYETDNLGATLALTHLVENAGRPIPIYFASSAKAVDETPYGRSKKGAEDALLAFTARTGNPVFIYRLVNVFGKWGRPNYNSAVATFCHNIARGLPIEIHYPSSPLKLIYVDDFMDRLIGALKAPPAHSGFVDAGPVYETTVGAVADQIRAFHQARAAGAVAEVGVGLTRALYATYIAYLPTPSFGYPLVGHADPRGVFTEFLKTPTAGQVSFFTSHPGVTRGGHYHHSKVEKFLIVQGEALFRFRHMLTGEVHEIRTSADTPVVVETIPGWTHDVTNVGDGVLVSMLWANEVFDRDRPDTIAAKV